MSEDKQTLSVAEILQKYYEEHPDELNKLPVAPDDKKRHVKKLKDSAPIPVHVHKRVKVTLTLDVVVCGECGAFLGVMLPNEK